MGMLNATALGGETMSESKPGSNPAEPLLGKERASILLHEYDGLRTEIIHRTNNMYQLFAADALVMGWIATSEFFILRTWIVLAAAAAATIYLVLLIRRDINKAADRLAEIEEQVDRDTGERYLLRWERQSGGHKTGYLGRARPLNLPDIPK